MGISKVCSIGNKIDVDECDLLDYLIADPATAAVALYLEAIAQGRRFLEIARKSQKPIVILKGGRSHRGAWAAFSHTASLAGDDRIVRGVLAQANITAANDFYPMMDLARALAMFPGGMGQGRVGVLTFTGSGGILSADFFADAGMRLADISDESQLKLKTFFPSWMPVNNPLDLWPAAELHGGKAYHRALEVAFEDSGIDAILIQIFVGGFGLDLDLEKIAAKSRGNHKPVFFWILGMQQPVTEFQKRAQKLGMPVFREISRAVAAMQAVYSYHNQKKTQEIIEQVPDSMSGELKAALQKKIEQTDSVAGVLDELDSKNILATVGIPTISEAAVSDSTEALVIAKKFGFPVVLKGLASGQIHKTEHGLVKLKIQNPDQLVSDFEDLTKSLKGHGRVLIQKYIDIDLEFICGMIRDPQFGPTVMFGIGGVMTEVFQDVVFRVAPLSKEEALDMLKSIRAKKLLEGFRGKPPVDHEELAKVLLTLGSIGCAAPRISQIDINPLAVSNRNFYALDATMILTNKLF
jgi:acetyltransferase